VEEPELYPVGWYEGLRAVEEAAIRAGFRVLDADLRHGVPVLTVELPDNTKAAFRKLVAILMRKGWMPVLERSAPPASPTAPIYVPAKRPLGVIRAVRFRPSKPGSSRIPLVLFIATLATLFATGWLLSSGWPEGPWMGALMYVGAMIAILATHELGHWIAARLHGVRVTPPYFIPAPPPLTLFGTFGAFIQQKTPAPDRDALFDIGLAGPLAGFIAALAVSFIGLPFSKIVIGPVIGVALPYIPAYSLIARIILSPPAGPDAHIWLHPVAFAGWTGMLVTMLNLIPAGSLDGGHIARCVLKPKAHMALGIVAAVGVIFLSLLFPGLYGGWYIPMALLALFMALSYRHPGALNRISALSPGRKVALIIPIIIFSMCILPIPLP